MSDPNTVFLHVEVVHPRPYEAAAFMEELFSATRVEVNISSYVERILPGTECVHVDLGGVTLQFIKPTSALPTWQEELERRGPHVHNISLQARDIEALRERLIQYGGQQTYQTEINARSANSDRMSRGSAYLIDAPAQVGLPADNRAIQ